MISLTHKRFRSLIVSENALSLFTVILGCPEKEKNSCFLEALEFFCSLSKKNTFEPNLNQIGHNLTKREPFKVDLALFTHFKGQKSIKKAIVVILFFSIDGLGCTEHYAIKIFALRSFLPLKTCLNLQKNRFLRI